MKYRREPKVAPDRQKTDPRDLVREVASTSSLCPVGRRLHLGQTPVRMVLASVCEVNAQLPPPSDPLAARLLAACLPRERHRALGDGRLQPDAGGLPLRPPRSLRLRPGA